MEIAKDILSLAYDIYCLVEDVKANKKRCQRVSERVKALEGLVSPISQRDVVQPSDQVETALTGLSITLKSAHELIKKYVSANLVKRILKYGSHGDEFSSMNDRLNDAFQSLALALQLEQGNAAFQLFEQNSRLEEDERDRKEDDAEMKRMLLEYAEYVEAMQRDLEEIKSSVSKIVEMLNNPSIISVDIRLIKPEELEYNQESFIMETPSSKVYKGQFGGFTVAIKKYLDPLTSPGEVKSVFDTEVDTMKRFESPNILRMFGICLLDENTPKPQYLIIMEYCEKGSLRDVLSSKWELTWTRKACMCLDAAQGLYRLHLTEEKSKVHGNITSNKFLVDANYRVKLGGFELAKTETTLRKMTKDKDRAIRSSCYLSPQLLNNIHHVYSKECEMYSFGIVLWEITTRKKPFEGCTTDDIHKKVYMNKYQEPLPPDCPEGLGQLISACRSFDSDQRPTAGVLVDKLRSVVVQLELQ
ncbi:mixed lineage kinase domain-like protein [Nematolebias whitei]|uniref:mixed lineage kinase domain-like protein n=1 Tax=Nematolebias whitei TaxID=451745 RepID=UPI00189A685A|nr:mixed lineage kinase domain-like protein [Nematolebias whitei]